MFNLLILNILLKCYLNVTTASYIWKIEKATRETFYASSMVEKYVALSQIGWIFFWMT